MIFIDKSNKTKIPSAGASPSKHVEKFEPDGRSDTGLGRLEVKKHTNNLYSPTTHTEKGE